MRTHWMFLSLGVALAGCATTAGRSTEKSIAQALVTDQQENQIGDQVYAELQQKGTKFVTDPTVTGYVTQISNRLLPLAQRERPGVNWRFIVIDDPKTVNAFSTPGGRLYVYTGLLMAAGNDAEIAGVMGHEMGHEVARHVARSLVEANGLEAVAALALGKNPNLLGQIATSIVGNGVLLHHSRGEETEADEYGARYTAAAGYNPQGLITFFQKLQQQEGHMPGVMKYLSDHPATGDRISHLQQYIAQNHLNAGGGMEAAQLSQVKSRVANLPPSATTSQPASGGQTPVHGQPSGQPAPAGQTPVHGQPAPSGQPPAHGQPGQSTPAPSGNVPVHHG